MSIQELKEKLLSLNKTNQLKIVSNTRMSGGATIRQEIKSLNLPSDNLRDSVWCIIYYDGIWPTCPICNKHLTNLKAKPSTCGEKECRYEQLSRTRSLITPEQQEDINRRRFETCIKKYGSKGNQIKSDKIKNTKKSYNKVNKILEDIGEKSLYTKEQIVEILNAKKYHYSKYIGKSKNRTMINNDPILYKSLLHHTNFIDEQKLYGKRHVPLSLRLLVAGRLKFNLTDVEYCRCKSRLSFDHMKMDFSHLYCDKCHLSCNSKDHYKYKYGCDWEYHYNKDGEKRSKTCRDGLATYISRQYGRVCPRIGNNEKDILDNIEKENNIIIDRDYRILGYYPDGYCHETNTIYEIYEIGHKSKIMYDEKRQREITKHLNCNFKIIYDGWNGNIS